MRILVLALLALFVTPAFAQGWGHYDNVRFGFGIDIPPDFDGQGESANSDGQAFAAKGNSSMLLVWGGALQDSFETDVASAMRYASDDAWTVSEQVTTPRWADFTAVKGQRILHHRMIMLCDNASYAAFRVEYMVTEATKMGDILNRLQRSLRGGNC